MLAAIKPTVGRISRYGVIPITADQDTAGPMAKTVSDVAIMFGVTGERVARSQRSGDALVHAAAGTRLHEVSESATDLKGARIGIPRAFFFDRLPSSGNEPPTAVGAGAARPVPPRGAAVAGRATPAA